MWSGANELSERQRATLVFRFEEELELSEIALATGMKRSTFKRQLYRGVGSIRDGMERSALSAIAERKWLDVEEKPFVVGHVLPFGACKLRLATSQGKAVRRRKSDRTFCNCESIFDIRPVVLDLHRFNDVGLEFTLLCKEQCE